VPPHSASTTPTTFVTTRNATPIDRLTTVLDDENLLHQAETGNDGLRFSNSPEASYQKDNGNDNDEASGLVSGVPPKPPTTSSATHSSTTIAAPTRSRTAAVFDTISDHPLNNEYNTLALLNDTSNHTTSRNTTSQPPAETNWFQLFQNQDIAPFSEQQYAEDWDFSPVQEPTSAAPIVSTDLSSYADTPWPAHPATGHSRPFGGFVYNPWRSLGRRRFNGVDDDGGWTALWTSRYLHDRMERRPGSIFDDGDGVPQSPSPKPERKPSSKIKVLFSKLKAYIKAPFRRHR
jgi:hypothetical protein